MAITFTALTGASNPFNGVDVGSNASAFFVDIDRDGDLDAFLARYGTNSIYYYKNTGTALNPVFVQQTGSDNPLASVDSNGALTSIAFTDIDSDGKIDAFITGYNGVDSEKVYYYKNTGTISSLAFAVQTGGADITSGFAGSGASYFAYTHFIDIDSDGDQDAFLGDHNGLINYYKNTGTASSAVFVQQTGASNLFNGIDVGSRAAPHFVDIDRDGDLDAFIGSFAGTLAYYKNTGTAINPLFAEQTGANNPFNGIDFGSDSKPSFADADGDGDLDLFVGDDDGTFKFYRNDSTAPVTPAYIERTGGSNPFNGVDVGSYAYLSFADINGDGDIDAFATNGVANDVRYFLNSGNKIAATFAEQTGASNPFNGTRVIDNQAPYTSTVHSLAIADINGDGDQDIIFVGSPRGNSSPYPVLYQTWNNTGSALTPAFSSGGTSSTGNINTTGRISLVDIDADGDQDMFVDRPAVNAVAFFENTGTAISPSFVNVTGAANPLNSLTSPFSYQVAFVDIDKDGDQDFFVNSNGTIAFYRNTGNATTAAFLNVTGSSNPFNGQTLSSGNLHFTDIDGDADDDLFISRSDGTIRYYENTAVAVPANAAPTLTGLVASVTYAENTVNATAQVVDSDVTFADADSADLNGGNLTITYSVGGGTEDQLAIRNEGTGAGQIGISGGTVTYAGVTIGTVPTSGAGSGVNGATLIVTFTAAAATPTAVDALIQNITYQNTSNSPTSSRTISITVNDGDGGTSTAATTAITVTAQNDAPVVAAFDATPSFTEGGAATVLDNNLTLSDADSSNLTGATISISANFVSGDRLNFTDQNGITGSYNTGTGVLTLTGTTTVANYQTALRTITFDSTSDNPTAAARTISLVVTDGTDNSNTPTITQSVTPVNDAPINVVPGAQTVTAGQNLVITGISTTDADHSSMATYVLSVDIGTLTLSTAVGGGVNAGQVGGNGTATVTITGATLAAINATLADAAGLTYTHSAAGAATLTITATDASAGSDADTVAITINAAPGGGSGGAVGSPAPSNPGDVITTPDDSGNLFGGAGDDTITMLDENNTQGVYVQAGAGADNITLGNRGDNTVAGGQGNDTIYGSVGRDHLNGNRGNDNIFGSNSADVLFGGKEDDFINGNGGNDTISGDLGHDGLRGGAGDDTITGGAGNDILWGDRGNDRLTGGSEIDTFAFTGNTGNDIITDFNAAEGDRLSLSGQAYTATTSGDNTVLTLADGSTITLTGVANFDSAWVQ